MHIGLSRNAVGSTAFALVVLFALANQAWANLIFDSTVNLSGSGAGLGHVNTITTARDNGSPPTTKNGIESGCVAWDGATTVTGSSACLGGLEGGDEQSVNNAVLIGNISGFTSLGDLAFVWNIAETGQDLTVGLDKMFLAVYDNLGTLQYTAFLDPGSRGDYTQGTGTGTGGAGFVFRLDAAQAAAANAVFGVAANWRIGGGFETVKDSTVNGHETLYVISLERRTAVPEPTTLGFFGVALAGLGFAARRRSKS